MKHVQHIAILVGLGLLIASCDDSSRNKNEEGTANDGLITEVDEGDGNGEYDDSGRTDNNSSDMSSIRLTGEIVQCNKCMGYGMVQDGLYGKPEICKFCWVSTSMRMQHGWTGFDGRYGLVDAVFNTLPADYFDELDWDTGGEYEDHAGDNGVAQIESEIERHEENIAQLEHQLEYIEGSINRMQIQQQIIEEQSEIRRLQSQLRYY